MHKNLVKSARVVLEISCRTDRQTDPQTYVLITILCNCSRERNKYVWRGNSAKTKPVSSQDIRRFVQHSSYVWEFSYTRLTITVCRPSFIRAPCLCGFLLLEILAVFRVRVGEVQGGISPAFSPQGAYQNYRRHGRPTALCLLQFWAHNRERWSSNAHSVKQYAMCVRDRLVDEYNLTSVQLYFDVWCSLNGRFQQRFALTYFQWRRQYLVRPIHETLSHVK